MPNGTKILRIAATQNFGIAVRSIGDADWFTRIIIIVAPHDVNQLDNWINAANRYF